MPRLTPVIRVKEKAIPALTKDRWHPTSLADEASDAKPLMVGNTNRSFCCRDSAQADQLLVRRLLAKTFGVALAKAGQPSTLRSLNHFFKLRAQHRFGSCCESMLPLYGCVMSTAREIEEAIRSLPASERDKLLHTIPDLFPELSGDAEWERIIHDERPRPSLSQFLDKTESEFRRDPGKFAELRDDDFASHS